MHHLSLEPCVLHHVPLHTFFRDGARSALHRMQSLIGANYIHTAIDDYESGPDLNPPTVFLRDLNQG